MKKITGLCCGLALLANTAMAQVTTVDGVGVDRDSAVRDAMRNAVENVIGTFIDSRTLVDKSVVALDEVYAKSQGFVKDIKVLREAAGSSVYRITAQIDVDTDPDSQLMDQLNMIMLLNNPRIAVAVEYYGEDWKEKYPAICEASMNNKLLELGFSHVVDSSIIRDDRGNIRSKNNDTDYIVLGKLDINTRDITLPSYKDMTQQAYASTSIRTGLLRSWAELDVRVLKTDTQEIIGTFRVEADAARNNVNNTENQAVKDLGIKAAEQLRKVFAVKAANVTKLMQVIVRTDSNDKVIEVEEAIKGIAGVNEVFIRSFNNGKGLIEVDSTLKPQQIYKALRGKLNLFMENASDNLLEVSI